MVLRKTTVDIPLTGGINQKKSEKLLDAPELLKLQNGRYLKEGRIDKRFGYTNLGQSVDTGTLNTPAALKSIRDELLMASADSLYSFSDFDNKWYKKGELSSGRTEISQISASPTSASHVDVISQDGIRVTVWAEDKFYYSVFDESTLSTIVNKTELIATTSSYFPRIVSINGYIFILYNGVGTNNLVYVRIPTASPSTTSTGNVHTDLATSGAFDACGLDDHFYIIYRAKSSTSSYMNKCNLDAQIVASQQISSANAGAQSDYAIYAFNSTERNKDLIIVVYPVSGTYTIKGFDVNLSVSLNALNLTSGGTVKQVILGHTAAQGNIIRCYITIAGAAAVDDYTRTATITISSGSNTGVLSAEAVLMRSVSIVSRLANKDGVGYFNVVHSSTLQPTYFTLTSDGKIVAKFVAGEGGSDTTHQRPSNFILTSASNKYVWGMLKKGRIQSGSGAVLFASLHPYFGILELSGATAFTSTNINDDFLIGGGVLRSYDGQSATEYGFHLFPEGVTLAETTGGSLSNTGLYSVQVIYEWTDARGVRFQSAPSIAVSQQMTSSNTRITVTVPSLRITDKSSDTGLISRAAVKIRVFVTTDTGTIHHYSTEVDNPDILTTDTIAINVDSAPATSAELLYTTGGVIENIGAPSHTYIFTHDNRPILLGLENPNQIRFGKDIKPLTGVGFNEDFSINLDPIGGGCKAGASMDNYMIIFKETATFAISGAGPNDLGIGSTYGNPQLISSDIGCKDVKSVLQIPDGILLKTNKGIYLLDRSLKYTYIGANVEDFNSDEVVSSDILKDSNEIRFVTDNDITLVYNYYFKRWATYTTPGALDATTWQDSKYVYLTSTQTLLEDSTTYLDNGSYVATTIKTGWINLSGIQGYQRVYRLALIGEYHTNHIFQIKQFYDYSDIVKDTTSITASSLVNTAVYGDSATYGADGFFGGSENNEVYQTRVHLKQQKCEAVSFEIVDAIQGTNEGQGFSLEGIALELGGKSGIFRTNNTRTQ